MYEDEDEEIHAYNRFRCKGQINGMIVLCILFFFGDDGGWWTRNSNGHHIVSVSLTKKIELLKEFPPPFYLSLHLSVPLPLLIPSRVETATYPVAVAQIQL